MRGEAQKRVSTGVSGLDAILGGGLPAGRTYVVEGDPGAGKTTLAMSFLLAGARAGEGGLFVTLSEDEGELRQMAASHGWSLEAIAICDLQRTAEPPRASDSQYTLFHPSEVELNETTRMILAHVERFSPRRVVLDSLTELRLLSRDVLRYRRQVLSLKQTLARRGVTSLFLDYRSKSRDSQIESIASGVIRLEQMSPEHGNDRRRLSVRKMRAAAFHGGYHEYTIGRGGLEVFPRLDTDGGAISSHASEPIASGIHALDALVGGGLEPGTATLLLGPSGAGKSSLAAVFAAAAARQGLPASVFLFDETTATWRSRTMGLGLSVADLLDRDALRLEPLDPVQVTGGEVAHRVRQHVADRGSRVVVVDSLDGYRSTLSDERTFAGHVHELLAYLKRLGIVTIVVASQRGALEPRIDPKLDITHIADNVVLVRYFDAGGIVRKAIAVLKKRSGTHLSAIRELVLDSTHGVQVGEPLAAIDGAVVGGRFVSGGVRGLRPDDASYHELR